MKKVFKILSVALYVFLLVCVAGKLFFEQDFNALVSKLRPTQAKNVRSLSIGVSAPIVSHDPRANDVGSRMYLLQTFESLVRRTSSLELESDLALSYGMLSSTQWEFRIRPNVHFHDGSILTADDVKKCLDISRSESSGLSDIFSTVTSIDVVGDLIHINTKQTDVLLPQKMASALIFKRVGNEFIGTGAYRPSSTGFDRFSEYWGAQPAYEKLSLIPLLTKKEKLAALNSSSVDVLMNIPADVADDFSQKNYSLVVQPGIESDMLLMNSSGLLSNLDFRKAVQSAVNPKTLARFGHGFATVINQLVPPAVFGYDPELTIDKIDLQTEQLFLNSTTLSATTPIVLDLPVGLETFGKTLSSQLSTAGIFISVKNITGAELNKKIVQAASAFYFFGWQHDLGDSLPFLASVIHSRTASFGEFNGMNYSNSKVDSLIEEALRTSDSNKRRELQRQVMKIVVVDDAIAVPLFSPDSLYAVKSGILFSPRVDGYVLASDFVVK